jgi:ribosomal protein S27AE
MPSILCSRCRAVIPADKYPRHAKQHKWDPANATSKARSYSMSAWRRVSRQVVDERDRLCTRCGAAPSEVAHHSLVCAPAIPAA